MDHEHVFDDLWNWNVLWFICFECRFETTPVVMSHLQYNVEFSIAMALVEHILDFELTKDTPYLALTGKLWGVCCEYM